MEKNRKILRVGLVTIAVATLISLGAMLYLKLDEPVFLKSFVELGLPVMDNGKFGQVHFNLRYITNANDTRVVNHIEIDEVPSNYINATEHDRGGFMFFDNTRSTTPGEIKGRYNIRTVYVTIDAYEMDNTKDEINLTKAKVHFTDGSKIDVDLGNIILYREDKSKELLDLKSIIKSSDGTSSTQGTVVQDITLLSVESPILEYVKDYLELKINGIEYNNISGESFKKGDSISANSKFCTPDDIDMKMAQIIVNPKLTYKDNNGNEHSMRFYDVNYKNNNISFKEIVQLLQRRGDI